MFRSFKFAFFSYFVFLSSLSENMSQKRSSAQQPPISPSLFLHISLLLSCPSSLSPPRTLSSLDPLPCLLLNRMSLHCTQEPCFYGSVSKQASQQDTVVQMSRGRSLTQPSEQSNKLNSLSLQSCCAKTPASHFNFCCRKQC